MEPITIIATEFYCRSNAKANHTEEYDLVSSETPTPILRRGSKFYFAVRFNRDFDPEVDVIRVKFSFGPKPNVPKGTRVILLLKPKQKSLPKETNQWAICLTGVNANVITLQVNIPPSAPVGIWNCAMQSNIRGERDVHNDYTVPDDIYIIFNPWCPEDGVYLEKEKERQEYVLNETGKIWCGTFKNPTGKHWIFGQFDDFALPAAVLLLEKSGLVHSERGYPVMVTRAISAIINAADDGGLLEGRWDGDYSDGTSPFAWSGSAGIMDQYLSSGGEPVKYGQCWVFSAATVTVCRALGIPCRSTTNYVSAHDTDMSLTIDKYFDRMGNKIENGPDGECSETCWNFHVWNDVWMTRPDLPPGYGGWQIIDGTPQELSGRFFRCGPASVEAVRKGEVGYLYDTRFVFAEVNADIIHFKEDEESDWGFSRLSVNKYHVGRKIITKRVGHTDDKGDSDMWIVTNLYKNLEGTEAERLAVYNAVRGNAEVQKYYEMPDVTEEDVLFDLIDIDTVPFGDSFDVVVKIENKSDEERNISCVISASSVFYIGSAAHYIKKSQGTIKVAPQSTETVKIRVSPEEYIDKLVDHSLLKIYAIAAVKETKQTWSEEDDFTLTLPEMTITLGGLCKVGETCNVNFSFRNPLDIALTNTAYTVEGLGLGKPKTVTFKDVQPKELVNITETFQARKSGERKIVATFTSKQIQNINGSTTVTIQE